MLGPIQGDLKVRDHSDVARVWEQKKETNEYGNPGRYRFICERKRLQRLRNRIEVEREPIGTLGPQFLLMSNRVLER